MNSPLAMILYPSPGMPGEGRGEGDFDRRAIPAIRNHPHPNPLPAYRERELIRARAFTLIEVMATMLLMSIVLPAVNEGIATATHVAVSARHRTDAASLAQSKLSELITNGQWQGGVMSGDCTTDWPDYRWQATITAWVNDTQAVGLQQLDVQITWSTGGKQESVTVSGLVYVRPVATS